MRYFLFIGIFGLMHYYIACAKLVLALIYCNFLKESIRHICQIRTTKGPLGLKEAEEV